MSEILWCLILVCAPVVGAFGAALLKLLITQPRRMAFVLVGILFLMCGLLHSDYARRVLTRLAT